MIYDLRFTIVPAVCACDGLFSCLQSAIRNLHPK